MMIVWHDSTRSSAPRTSKLSSKLPRCHSSYIHSICDASTHQPIFDSARSTKLLLFVCGNLRRFSLHMETGPLVPTSTSKPLFHFYRHHTQKMQWCRFGNLVSHSNISSQQLTQARSQKGSINNEKKISCPGPSFSHGRCSVTNRDETSISNQSTQVCCKEINEL